MAKKCTVHCKVLIAGYTKREFVYLKSKKRRDMMAFEPRTTDLEVDIFTITSSSTNMLCS